MKILPENYEIHHTIQSITRTELIKLYFCLNPHTQREIEKILKNDLFTDVFIIATEFFKQAYKDSTNDEQIQLLSKYFVKEEQHKNIILTTEDGVEITDENYLLDVLTPDFKEHNASAYWANILQENRYFTSGAARD